MVSACLVQSLVRVHADSPDMNPFFYARLLRALPPRLAQSLYYRCFRGQAARWPQLFRAARLRDAPSCRMDLVPGDEVSNAIALTGVYELEVTRLLKVSACSGGVLVDVGANLGYHSLLWASHLSGCQSIAIEASPEVFPLLTANVASNPTANIEAHCLAASNISGLLRFATSGSTQMGWGHVCREGGIEVPCRRLDEILQGRACLQVLKVDAEGHDLQVLLGASALIRDRAIKTLIFESAYEELCSPDGKTLLRQLEEAGYTQPSPIGKQTEGSIVFVSTCG